MSKSIIVTESYLSAHDFAAIHQKQEQQRYPAAVRQRQVAPGKVPAKWATWWNVVWLLLLTGGAWLVPKPFKGYIIIALVTALVTAVGLWYRHYEYRRAYQQSPTASRPTSFTILEHGVVIEQQHEFFTLLWSDFYHIRRVGRWWLLYPNADYCYYLNMRNIMPPATEADLLELLHEYEILAR
ncbi:hypothetical protein [Hymenobacter sp. YC55]|uniref:hypothetical protein n=1 Tax=Hymenobacter sp. YC55 TaxID=3034019 RepID=UPI0023F68648|nr:hypothetical protein [Hymenobacter sp. YC55]MDF7810360.1 hypothetical protein [Hymenobacter sp. YC55]